MRYLRAVRRQAWLIGLCLASGLASAGIFLATQQSVYRASMKIVVGQGGGIFQPAYSGSVDPLTQTMTNLLESNVVASAVIRNLGLSLKPRQLLGHLAASTRPQTAVLNVRYDSSNKAEAVTILRETGNVFAILVSQLGGQKPSGETGGVATIPVSARTFDPAHLEPGRVSPRPLETLLIAGALATFLGVALAFARESLKPRIDSREQAEQWFGTHVLGTLPKGSVETPPLGPSGRRRRSEQLAHALGLLTAQLQARQGTGGRVIVVTSTADDESKSMVVAHLGAALAAAGEDVICVEADTRAPTVGRHLGVDTNSKDPERYGLIDVVDGRIELEGALHAVRPVAPTGNAGNPDGTTEADSSHRNSRPLGPPLRLLPAGGSPSSDVGALSSETLISLMKTLASTTRYLIVDAPPMLLSAHALPLATASDAILVVAQLGSTTKADAEAVRRIFATVEQTRIDVVLCHPLSTRRRIWSRVRALRPVQTTKAVKVADTTSRKAAPRRERSASKPARDKAPGSATSRGGKSRRQT